MSVSPLAIELRNLTKRFGNVVANDGINLRVRRGTIHGLVGENGAGKSTAMKILYGLYRPDGGEIFVEGNPCVWASPSDALAQGIGMVHQHFMLAGRCSALDNIILGCEPRRWGTIARKQARAKLDTLARQYGLPVNWDQPVEDLPPGLQQRIEILKLLFREANILILDEPTSVLTPAETQALFANLRRLRDEGKTIIIITHKLNEVLALTERITVFRSGKVTGEVETSRTNAQELANLMVGREVVLNVSASPGLARNEPALEVKNLSLTTGTGNRMRLSSISFSVNRGEIVGIAGVEGNGQSELIQALLHPYDSQCRTSGTVKLLDQDVTNWETMRIRSLGVAFIPEDRHHEGLLLERPVSENFLLGLQRDAAFGRAGFLDLKQVQRTASRALKNYRVQPDDLAIHARNLSGGNQQKLIVAREFYREPKIVIAAHPTRGVDVGAIEFIHRRIIQARDSGAAILLISSELEEILDLSDRILVMCGGRLVAEFKKGSVSQRELGLKMGGA